MEFAGLTQNQNFDRGNVAEVVDTLPQYIVIVLDVSAAFRDASDESLTATHTYTHTQISGYIYIYIYNVLYMYKTF